MSAKGDHVFEGASNRKLENYLQVQVALRVISNGY